MSINKKIVDWNNKTLEEIEQILIDNKCYCADCKQPIVKGHMQCYSLILTGGVIVKGYEGSQWVYYKCPDFKKWHQECRYGTSLAKFNMQLFEKQQKDDLQLPLP